VLDVLEVSLRCQPTLFLSSSPPHPTAREFYREVMGGGGGNIHYGIYPADASSTADSLPEHNLGVKEAAENTITFLGDQISWARKLVPDSVVLDLGSGNKGAAFSNATRFGCKVVRFNLGVVGRLPSPRIVFKGRFC
jgi:hypothetical protein